MFRHFRFQPAWPFTLLTLAAFLLLSWLGIWQLQRADEKIQRLAALKQALQQAFTPWRPDKPLPTNYQAIAVKGEWLHVMFFLDNQPMNHRQGFQVISPVLLANNRIVLIDRGWIARRSTRMQLPNVPALSGTAEIQGQVYYPTKPFVLGQLLEPRENNRWIAQALVVEKISEVLHKPVYPFIIRQRQTSGDGLIRHWKVVAMSPERHYGYALQWFLMALVVVILYVALNIKKANDCNQ